MFIRKAAPKEFKIVGNMMVEVYSSLPNFPQEGEMPDYYEYLRNVGDLTENKNIDLFVVDDDHKEIIGAVVFISDMADYGSGGIATEEKNACGFRLLTVSKSAQGKGLGKKIVHFCIEKAKEKNVDSLIIHTTEAMKLAWGMYERMGFRREDKLDFIHGDYPVFGFRKKLKS